MCKLTGATVNKRLLYMRRIDPACVATIARVARLPALPQQVARQLWTMKAALA
jgi:hypothetical protein